MEFSNLETSTGARAYHIFPTTRSALVKRRVSRFPRVTRCTSCERERLTAEALSVGFADRTLVANIQADSNLCLTPSCAVDNRSANPDAPE